NRSPGDESPRDIARPATTHPQAASVPRSPLLQLVLVRSSRVLLPKFFRTSQQMSWSAQLSVFLTFLDASMCNPKPPNVYHSATYCLSCLSLRRRHHSASFRLAVDCA